MRNFSKNCNFIEKREVCMRTRLVVSFFICFLLQACSGASTTKTNGVSNTSGNDQAGCIALDTIGIDGAVEKFVWNEEDGIGFLIQDNSYLDFIKSSFTSRPVFAMCDRLYESSGVGTCDNRRETEAFRFVSLYYGRF